MRAVQRLLADLNETPRPTASPIVTPVRTPIAAQPAPASTPAATRSPADDAKRAVKERLALAEQARSHAENARVLLERQRYAEAEAAYEEAMKKDPSSATYATGYAWTIAVNTTRPQQERLRQALEQLKGLVQKFPKFAEAHYTLGMVQQMLGRDRDAEKAMQVALMLEKNHHGAQRMIRLLEMRRQKEKPAESSGLLDKLKLR